ncbi:MAG TPA: hypothetical protein VN324_10220 [Quisquiliibacterium sp.]|nr:hypothetical protein [Quisquiliibacterium sp.]
MDSRTSRKTIPVLARLGTMLALLLWAALATPPAHASAECEAMLSKKRISLVVPFKPGGGFDAYARMLAPVLEARTGARVVVTNLAGANGMAGVRAVATAGPGSLVLGLFEPRSLYERRQLDPSAPDPASVFVLGSLNTVPRLWVGKRGFDLRAARSRPLLAGATSAAVASLLLPAESLGLELKVIRGYPGSADRWLALARGEIDVVDGSADSLRTLLESSPEMAVVLALDDVPVEGHPGVPHLAGPGGLVDRLTSVAGFDPKERATRMAWAQLAVDLSVSTRAISVAASAPPALRACLDETIAGVLASDALKEAAGRARLDLKPTSGPALREALARIEAGLARNQALVKRLGGEGAL